MIQNTLKKITFSGFVLICFYIIFWGLIIRANLHRIGSFAFFDEYSTYVTGFFMLKGRTLFDQVFLNHQPLLSYFSYVMQMVLKPESFYVLATQHRISVLVFSIICSLLLVFRFRYIGIAFTIFFELTKFYLFGSLFLAESVIVYPIAYMTGLIVLGNDKKFEVRSTDVIISSVLAWFVIFMREPYAPLAIFQFIVILYLYKNKKIRSIAISLFGVLSTITLATLPLKEYYYQLVTINANSVGGAELESNNIFGTGVLKVFFYPIYIFISGEANFFRLILIILSVIFIVLFGWFIFRKKQYIVAFLIFITLGLANIRFIEPGQIYFVAFHMLPWMAVFLMMIFSLLYFFRKSVSIQMTVPIFVCLFIILGIGVFQKDTFILKRVNKESEFNDNYIRFRTNGEVIKRLSSPEDKLFVDMSDSLVHYYAGLDSSYKYAFFYPVMSGDKKYITEREMMFEGTPPEFYYFNCFEGASEKLRVSESILKNYNEFKQGKMGTCLFVRKDVLNKQPKEKLESLNEFNYTIN